MTKWKGKQTLRRKLVWLTALLISNFAFSQKTIVVDSSDTYTRTVIAGRQYKASRWHQWLWGKDYRREWTTAVKIPVLNLDSAFGGLIPVKEGGGRQTKSLRLINPQGRQFVLRTVDKTYSGALPEIVQGTLIEHLANDQIATNHPYAALTIPQMAGASKIYHTHPHYYLVPYNERLGEYNEVFANTICLLEERPDETQTTSFGNPQDIVSTEKMFEKITDENDHLMDQHDYVKTRLFDMFLGDWGRHPDNWRWAKFDSGSFKIYRPVPKDRDQTYAKFEGILLSLIIRGASLRQLQTFNDKIHNVEWYNYPPMNLDRRFTNELPKQVWMDSAKVLQQYLTDVVIENAVAEMPPEIFAESGNEIIRKLKARRNQLVNYADKYYDFLAARVDVPGSKEDEIFEVQRLNSNVTAVSVYPLKKNGEAKKQSIYSRTFLANETKEIRLYGVDGNDVYHITGNTNNKIKIRIIGGTDKDSLINESARVKYYDNYGNFVSGNVSKHFSGDTSVNRYDWKEFKLAKKGILFLPYYKNERGFFIEAGYRKKNQQWRKQPSGWQQSIIGIYSISNASLGAEYKGIFNQIAGKWNLLLDASFDQKLKNYFHGFGNETTNTEDPPYYRFFTEEGRVSAGLNRIFDVHNSFTVSGFYNNVRVRNEKKGFVSENLINLDPASFNTKNFVGAQIDYAFYNVNDAVIPTKGFGFSLSASRTKNVSQTERSFNRYWTTLGFYIPLGKTFSFASRNGAATLDGNPEFYQYNWLGGGQNLRGFRRQRFYGKSIFYNNNELRWISNVKGYVFTGKIGLIGFLDDGRVWMPNEVSDKWHVGYGGGLLLSPFSKIAITVYYGVSEDDRLFHLRLGKFF